VVRILEEILPQRFGGAPGDYQLVEEEASFQTRILLRVSPRSGVTSSKALKAGFLKEVRRIYGGSTAGRTWQHTGAVQVIIGEPYVTPAGKVLPLHLLGPRTGNTHES